METKKLFVILAITGVALAGAGAISVSHSLSQRPTSSKVDNTASPSRPPYDPQLVQQTLEFWAGQARSDAQGAIARNKLAHLYLDRYRETGDIADAKRAEQVARESLKIRAKNNGDALFQLSRSLLTQHRFKEALVEARRAALYSAEAYRQCADIEIELGDYEAAKRDFAKVPRAEADSGYLALASRLHAVQGRSAEELALLQKAARLADANLDMPHQSVAWFHERLGHCLALRGNGGEAEKNYQAALAVFPRDYRTMAAMAHLEANRNNWPQAIVWAKKAAAIVPAPETIALLGDAYAASGNSKAAKQQFALIEAMGTLERAQGAVYDRQRALFNADHNRNVPEALKLARGELKMRRDIYSYDTLAWVLYKNGQFDEAAKASTSALAQGTQDALLYYHAGMIANARGEKAKARDYLERALKINAHFHPTAPRQARGLLAQLSAAQTQPISHQDKP